MSEKPDLRATLATRMLDVVFETFADETGTAHLDPVAVRHAFVLCAAMVIEADPDVRTPKDMREASELFAKELLRQIKGQRILFERTGERPLDVASVSTVN